MNKSTNELMIDEFTRFSMCDWPGQFAATIFCKGCDWHCPYCQNPSLRPLQYAHPVSWEAIFDFLRCRTKLLDAVIFSGCEPLLQPAIVDAVAEVSALGFRVGLHTTGIEPKRFAAILPKLDWVGFSVKASSVSHTRLTTVEQSEGRAIASLKSLIASNIPYAVRTTLHPVFLSREDFFRLKGEL